MLSNFVFYFSMYMRLCIQLKERGEDVHKKWLFGNEIVQKASSQLIGEQEDDPAYPYDALFNVLMSISKQGNIEGFYYNAMEYAFKNLDR